MPVNNVDARLRVIDEGPLPVVDAYLQVTGRAVHPKTALRWAVHGVRGLRLETVKLSNRRLTSVAAMRRWLAAVQPQAPPPKATTLDEAAADAVLAAYGLGREA